MLKPDKHPIYNNYNTELVSRAKQMRKAMTPQEQKLWYLFLRQYPVKFYRQRPIGWYIADFYCSKAKLIIELDGSQHFTVAGKSYDDLRTEVIEQRGIFVLRSSNDDINRRFENVCDEIDRVVRQRLC